MSLQLHRKELYSSRTCIMDARTLQASSSDHTEKHKENCDGGAYKHIGRGEIDFRIQGLLHSAVEHDYICKEAVQKFFHQFETHPDREALQTDLDKDQAFNPFSEQSKDMIYNVGSMECLKIGEITPNIKCANCMTYWTKGVVFCSCGTCLRPSDKVRRFPTRSSKKARPREHATGTRRGT